MQLLNERAKSGSAGRAIPIPHLHRVQSLEPKRQFGSVNRHWHQFAQFLGKVGLVLYLFRLGRELGPKDDDALRVADGLLDRVVEVLACSQLGGPSTPSSPRHLEHPRELVRFAVPLACS